MAEAPHHLRIFLCHSSGDKQAVRDLYKRLRADGFDPWLDEENLLPGQDWQRKIPEAVNAADVVLVCLSRSSITKKGYVQKEIKFALDVADQQPEDTIYLIPLKLEECDIPERLRRWHWVRLFEASGYERLMIALRHRAESISVNPGTDGLQPSSISAPMPEPVNYKDLLERERQLREATDDHQRQDEEQKRHEDSAVRAEEIRDPSRLRELETSWDEENERTEKATQERPEEIQIKAARRNRIRKLSWVGISVVAVLGTIIVAIKLLTINLPNAETYLNRGKECDKKKDVGCAVDNFTKAIELDPQYAIAYLHRGISYDKKGDYDQALKDFSKAIELNPQLAEAYNTRGGLYSNKGDYDQALKDFSKAVELSPQDALYYNNRGFAYNKKGDYDQALKDCNKAVGLNPQLASAYRNRGNAYRAKGGFNQAITDYSKAIELDPQFAAVYSYRGAVYAIKGDYDQALKDFSKAVELNPQNALYYSNRGKAYEEKGNYDQAIIDYNKAIELNPQSAGSYVTRGLVYNAKGNRDKAINDFTKAIESNPQSALAYEGRGVAHGVKKNYDQAIKDLTKAVELNPQDAHTYYARAWVYEQLG